MREGPTGTKSTEQHDTHVDFDKGVSVLYVATGQGYAGGDAINAGTCDQLLSMRKLQ